MTSQDYRTSSFTLLMDLHYLELVNFTTFNIKDKSAAESLVVNTFIKIWRLYKEKFLAFENKRFYLFRACYLEGKNFIERNTLLKQQENDNLKLTHQFSQEVDFNLLIGTLPTHLEKIIRLSHLDNLSLEKVASQMSLPLLQVKNLKSQAEDLLAIVLHQ